MSIKKELTAAEWGELDGSDQDLYEQKGDGYSFIGANPKKILEAKRHEKDRANSFKAEADKLRKEIQALKDQQELNEDDEDAAADEQSKDKTESNRVERLKKRLAKQQEEHAKALQERDDKIAKEQLDATIKDVVHKAFADQHIGELVVKERVGIEVVDGVPKLRFKDRNGDVAEEMNAEGLVKDLRSDDRYKNQVVSDNRASGGFFGGAEETSGTPSGGSLDGMGHEAIKERFFGGQDPMQMSDGEFQKAAERFAKAGGMG